MKKEMWGIFGVLLFVSLGFVSAGWFDWLKPTGNVVASSISINLSGTYCSQVDGSIGEIADQYIDDYGMAGAGDSLQFFCRNHVLRICLSNEVCPWRTSISSSDSNTCAGDYPYSDSKMASISNSSILSGISISDFARLKISNIDIYCNKNFTSATWALNKVTSIPAKTCVDTDNGLNYNINGSVMSTQFIGGNPMVIIVNDRCLSSNIVQEAYCNSSGDIAVVNYTCPDICGPAACVSNSNDGYIQIEMKRNQSVTFSGGILITLNDIWSDSVEVTVNNGTSSGVSMVDLGTTKKIAGIRVNTYLINISNDNDLSSYRAILRIQVNPVSTMPYCIDSDNGLNYDLSGSVESFSDSVFSTSYDYCYSNYVLEENYCKNSTSPGFVFYTCPNGCFNNICLGVASTNQTCTDSDGGLNYNVQGTVNDTNNQYYPDTDYCSSTKLLQEFSCVNGEKSLMVHSCTDRCYEGACVNISVIDYTGVCSDALKLMEKLATDGNLSSLGITDDSDVSFFSNSTFSDYFFGNSNWVKVNISEYSEHFSSNSFLDSDNGYNYNYYSYNVNARVYSDLNENNYYILNDQMEKQWGKICQKTTIDDQVVYVCQEISNALKNSNSNDNGDNSVLILWSNKNVLFGLDIYEYKSNSNKEDKINDQVKDFSSTLESLNNNQYKWVDFDFSWFTQNHILSKFLSACPSTLVSNGTWNEQSQWQCTLEPAQCPPHGYRTQKCVDTNNILPDTSQQLSCNPGVCAGCMMPKWEDSQWGKTDTKCMPYGARWQIRNGYTSENTFIDRSEIESLTVADSLSSDGLASLTVLQNNTALLSIYSEESHSLINFTFENKCISNRIRIKSDQTWGWSISKMKAIIRKLVSGK